MAGMRITVCLPSAAADRLETAVAEALAPFEIDYTGGDELDIWDSWYITGGQAYGGGFNVLPGHERDPRLIHEYVPPQWSPRHERVPNDFGWCAGGPRALLDFSASHEEARELAEAAWQQWQDLAADLPPANPWQVYYDRTVDQFRTYPFDQASADYRAQPLVQAFDSYLATLPTERYSYWFLGFTDPVVDVGCTGRQEFVVKQMRAALRKRNVLTLDGWWHEDGGPGIHGTCHSPAKCPHAPELPAEQDRIDGYLADLPGDTLLVHVRCHV
ncbi:hypothetical protein [Streptomyces sp. NPDC029004]|uniref:hypothetical protein n=1 Tax=Streptomyces sp. NPDC029004 TaxID=3154490 RepID=UPI003406B3B1